MRSFQPIAIVLLGLVFVPARYADEGMWTFDNPPLKLVEERYELNWPGWTAYGFRQCSSGET